MAFSNMVEQWRALLEQYGDDIPVDFMLAWMADESAGNPCDATYLNEWGIFQLMQRGGTDNVGQAGTTVDALRSACDPPTAFDCPGGRGSGCPTRAQRTQTRPLTLDEMTVQVTSGVKYIKGEREFARQKLAAVGAEWPENSADFWSMVKLHHTQPSLMNGLAIATQNLGRPPATWDEFVVNGAGDLPGGSHWLPFAAKIGAFGATDVPLVSQLSQLDTQTFGAVSMTPGEGILIVLLSIGAMFGALRLSRWLAPAKSV